MTIKQLQNIYQLILAAEIDCDRLSVEEIEDLRLTVKDAIYEQQLKDFANHLDFAMPMDDDKFPSQAARDKAWDDFYSKDWTIMFDGKSITIPNGAAIFGGMQDTIAYVIDQL